MTQMMTPTKHLGFLSFGGVNSYALIFSSPYCVSTLKLRLAGRSLPFIYLNEMVERGKNETKNEMI